MWEMLYFPEKMQDMKSVLFVRHAKSSWEDLSLRDIDRPLNKRGLKDAPLMGKLLRKKGVSPDRLISSPALRALTTAEFFARELGIAKEEIEIDRRIYDAFPEDLIQLVREIPDDQEVVLIFGHNPTYTSLANLFAMEMIDNIPTCGVFRIDAVIDSWRQFSQEKGRLTAFYYPKQFKK